MVNRSLEELITTRRGPACGERVLVRSGVEVTGFGPGRTEGLALDEHASDGTPP